MDETPFNNSPLYGSNFKLSIHVWDSSEENYADMNWYAPARIRMEI